MTARRRSSQSLKRPRQRKIAINRDPLHIQVADRLRDMIVHGDLKPGEKVPFAMLAAAGKWAELEDFQDNLHGGRHRQG